ncbi:Protein CBG02658 [Caenorhabditis briggsae]|uniref:Protein CBG02658 n=1 Tax=Caenorhabditis briggsae TaxID=6238 RepID=A8WTT5_CAEBR|nr:Protein CBG02658 [Caenorhabditis briggsae]CAP23897.2 Protein CBG02658 [Caenorhabditis briggsae]
MRATVSLLNCCDVPPSHHPSMNAQMLFETCHFLPLPPAPTQLSFIALVYSFIAISSSC